MCARWYLASKISKVSRGQNPPTPWRYLPTNCLPFVSQCPQIFPKFTHQYLLTVRVWSVVLIRSPCRNWLGRCWWWSVDAHRRDCSSQTSLTSVFQSLHNITAHTSPAPLSTYLTLKNIVTLKSRSGVTRCHLKWHHSIACIRGDWTGPQPAQASPRCTKCNIPYDTIRNCVFNVQ